MRWSGGNAALFVHRCLYLGRATQRIDDAGELDQEPVTGRLDDAAPMARDLRVYHLGAQRLKPAERAFLVGFDQARVAYDIGREDRREPTFDASLPCGLHGASPVAHDPTSTAGLRALSTRPADRLAIFASRSRRTIAAGLDGLVRAIRRVSRLRRFFPDIDGRNSRL
jgi:hypothetical protein